jgi:ribonuclease HI
VPGKQTNNRAELFAVLWCLSTAPLARSLIIFTDSQYAIRSIVEWAPSHSKCGWSCENGDVLAQIASWIVVRQAPLELEHVPGHSGNKHGDAADALAKEGARLPLSTAPALPVPGGAAQVFPGVPALACQKVSLTLLDFTLTALSPLSNT